MDHQLQWRRLAARDLSRLRQAVGLQGGGMIRLRFRRGLLFGRALRDRRGYQLEVETPHAVGPFCVRRSVGVLTFYSEFALVAWVALHELAHVLAHAVGGARGAIDEEACDAMAYLCQEDLKLDPPTLLRL